MNLSKQKKLVARTLGVSPKRIKLKTETPENSKAIKEVISREGAKELLAEKLLQRNQKKEPPVLVQTTLQIRKRKEDNKDTEVEKELQKLVSTQRKDG